MPLRYGPIGGKWQGFTLKIGRKNVILALFLNFRPVIIYFFVAIRLYSVSFLFSAGSAGARSVSRRGGPKIKKGRKQKKEKHL